MFIDLPWISGVVFNESPMISSGFDDTRDATQDDQPVLFHDVVFTESLKTNTRWYPIVS